MGPRGPAGPPGKNGDDVSDYIIFWERMRGNPFFSL